MRRSKSHTSTRDHLQIGRSQDREDLGPWGQEEPSGLALRFSGNHRTVRENQKVQNTNRRFHSPGENLACCCLGCWQATEGRKS